MLCPKYIKYNFLISLYTPFMKLFLRRFTTLWLTKLQESVSPRNALVQDASVYFQAAGVPRVFGADEATSEYNIILQ